LKVSSKCPLLFVVCWRDNKTLKSERGEALGSGEDKKKMEMNFVMLRGKTVICVTNNSRLMTFCEIVAFYSDNHAKHTHTHTHTHTLYMYMYVHIDRGKSGDSECESRWFTYLQLCFRVGLSDIKLLRARIHTRGTSFATKKKYTLSGL
jgi:hypothetical protein